MSTGAALPSLSPDPGGAFECHRSALWSGPPVGPSWRTNKCRKQTLKAETQHRLAETSSFPLQLLTQCSLFTVFPLSPLPFKPSCLLTG